MAWPPKPRYSKSGILGRPIPVEALSSSRYRNTSVNNCTGKSPAACISTRLQQHQVGHDWLIDRQPTNGSSTTTGMVPGSNIARPDQVGVQRVATLPTHKQRARTTVVAGSVPTAETSLRGMVRIDRSHRTTSFLCLVL